MANIVELFSMRDTSVCPTLSLVSSLQYIKSHYFQKFLLKLVTVPLFFINHIIKLIFSHTSNLPILKHNFPFQQHLHKMTTLLYLKNQSSKFSVNVVYNTYWDGSTKHLQVRRNSLDALCTNLYP